MVVSTSKGDTATQLKWLRTRDEAGGTQALIRSGDRGGEGRWGLTGVAPNRHGVVEVLRRWEGSGAIWRVRRRGPASVEISLLTCSAGEEVDRLSSDDPDVLRYVAGRWSSEEPGGGS